MNGGGDLSYPRPVKRTFANGLRLFTRLAPCLAAASLSAVEIIGHRGASFDAPENTLSSMNLAWEQKADGIETDIHLSQDGQIVVIHDYDTLRVSGVNLQVVKSPWEQLARLDVGSWKGPSWAGEKLPTLPSLIKTIPAGKCILIELKVHAEILPALAAVFEAVHTPPGQLRIITFYLETAQAAKARFPAHEVYWLVGYGKDKATGRPPQAAELIDKARAAKLDGLDLDAKFPIDTAFVNAVHAAGLKLHVWTVDDPVVARKLSTAGVDGLTTNRPRFLREQLKN